MWKNGLFTFAAAMMLCLLLIPALGQAQAVSLNEEAQGACLDAGGVLLKEPCVVCVLSPYGTQSVVLRDAPSDSYDAVAMLMVGQEVTAAGECDTFYFVLLEDGVFGWLASDELEEIK